MSLSEEERLDRLEKRLDSIDQELKKLNENLYIIELNSVKRIDELEARVKVLEHEKKSSWGRKDVMYLLMLAASWAAILLMIAK